MDKEEQWAPLQWMVISWIPRFTGTLSFIGSSSIIYMILSDRENKLAKPNHRLMLSMSTFDVLSSAAMASSTWSFPRESNVYGSMGNMTTCKVQYFFATLGLAVPMYNASLCLLYLLTIRYRLHQRYFATKIEPYLHAASVLFPLVIATVPVIIGENVKPNRLGTICGINNESPFLWALLAVPALSFCTCLYSMVSLSWHVHVQSKRMIKYSYGTRQMQRRQSEKRATINQAILYIAAFSITLLFAALSFLHFMNFPIEVLKSFFYPLQGFWNCLLYIRANVVKMKKAEPHKYLCAIIWSVILHSHERNEGVKQKRRKKENKHKIQLKHLELNLDMDMNDGRNKNDEESKEEISIDLPRPIARGQSCSFIRNESDNEGASHIIKSGICDESNEQYAVPHTSLALVTSDDDLHSSDGSIEPCVVRRASLVFATAVDDISFHSLDSRESVE